MVFPVVKILDGTHNEWLHAKEKGTHGQKTSYDSQALLIYQEYDNCSSSEGWEYILYGKELKRLYFVILQITSLIFPFN